MTVQSQTFSDCPFCYFPLNIRMSDSEDTTVVLLVTRLDYTQTWVDRNEAFTWGTTLIRDICQCTNTVWKGDLKTVVPWRASINGFIYKFILVDVPDEVIDSVLTPEHRKRECSVKRLDAREANVGRKQAQARIHENKKRADMLGDVGKLTDLMTELKQMRGTEGPEAKARKFSDEAMSVLSISARICDSQLNKNKPAAD